MTEQAIVKSKSNGKELVGFGGRSDIVELSRRLQTTMPGGKKLTPLEANSLAQLAVAHGLDPFNGEVWIIPGSGLMVGIKGLRKKARNQAKDEDGTFWTDQQRVKPEKYHAEESAIVYECHLRDTVTVGAWAKSINLMTSAGVPYEDAVAALGKAPVYIGVGIATTDEKSKMPIHQRARKRAEADAIKQRYDVEFANAEFSADEPDAVEGEFTLLEDEPRDEETILSELGFDPEPKEQPEPEDANPDPISDQAWEEWQKLVEQAKEKSIPVPNVNRERTTTTDLRPIYDELRKKVNK